MTAVSTSTQCDVDQAVPPFQATRHASKKQPNHEDLILHDYLDTDDVIDQTKLQAWCHAQWLTTLRPALLHRNRLQYHSCCNSFSRRHFIRVASHPADETFEILKLRDFKTIENAEDFHRWQLNLAKENNRNGLKTFFPSINMKYCHSIHQRLPVQEEENKTVLKKRLADLEREVEENKRMLACVQAENSRLWRSSKAWHSKYEELLDTHADYNELLATPVKKLVSNWNSFGD